MSRLWKWLRWISLPARHRRQIKALDDQEAALLAQMARIQQQMAEMGMDHEKWWTERGQAFFKERQP